MAKGLADTLRRGEFDRLGYSLHPEAGALPWVKQGVGEDGMLGGDMGWVQSYDDIQHSRIWLGENVIKLENGTYWAFPFSGKFGITMNEVKDVLKTGYIETKGHPPLKEMPGLQDNVFFFDVPSIGMKVFVLRGGKE